MGIISLFGQISAPCMKKSYARVARPGWFACPAILLNVPATRQPSTRRKAHICRSSMGIAYARVASKLAAKNGFRRPIKSNPVEPEIRKFPLRLVTGGERSGKSRYARDLACRLSPCPVYVATARAWDADFARRIHRHQAERDDRWTNLEEEKFISRLPLTGRTVVLDCITLWLTNFFSDLQQDLDRCLEDCQAEVDRALELDVDWIMVSNEIGMGVHATSEAGRKFTELQGWMNQHIARRADEVVLMVSGIPVTIKKPPGE